MTTTTGVRRIIEAHIDACGEHAGTNHGEPHLRHSMVWPDSSVRHSRMLYCLGYYDQTRQGHRVIIGDTDGVEELLGEGLSLTGSAYREHREPGECGECREPEEFGWDLLVIVNDAPAIVCHKHALLAPGWAYEVEVGLAAYQNPEHKPLHYCAYPDRPGEPTLCGKGREVDSPDPQDAVRRGHCTTIGADVTCRDCERILRGAA